MFAVLMFLHTLWENHGILDFRLRLDYASSLCLSCDYVNASFLQVPTPEFGHGARARVQGLHIVFGRFLVLGYFWFSVSEQDVIFRRRSGLNTA